MLRKGLGICCQHHQDWNTELRSSVLALTLSYSHCLQKSTETKEGKHSSIPPAQLLFFSSTLEWSLCIVREFSLLAPAIPFWITYCCSWSSCSRGKHLEGRLCKIPVLLYMHVRELRRAGLKQGSRRRTKEKKRNGCRKSVLGKMKIPGSSIPMIALCKSITMAS